MTRPDLAALVSAGGKAWADRATKPEGGGE
jgi:hypothetical protein